MAAKRERRMTMDGLTLFGLFAVTAMLVCYALEDRSHWFILAFRRLCAGFGLRISARRLAIRTGRGCLGGGRAVALGCQAALQNVALQNAALIEILFRRRRPDRSSSGRRQSLAARCTDARRGVG